MEQSAIIPESVNWGTKPYREAWQLQLQLQQKVTNGETKGGYIVRVQHPPVYTLGFHGNSDNFTAGDSFLESSGAEVIRTERGGDITYHGPGQLVVYPIVNLRTLGMGVRKYVETLEGAVISLLREWEIHAVADGKEIGVWLDRGKASARKICAIGVKVRHGVTMHGLALNVNTDLEMFKAINPCGILDKGVTSMQKELGNSVDFEALAIRLMEILQERLSAPA